MEWTRGHTLGRGSTATVSVAEARGSRRMFAVKSAELHRSEFLMREQRILSALECPQIVAYKGCDITFENGTFLYNLLMEYAPYGSIADEIREHNGGLDEAVVGRYARQILLGLNYLHSNGIVHCDLKGRNVLLTDEGAKIADLGCARRGVAADDYGGAIAGTPAFMAPEVARGEQQGFPTDVWALGCTVLEMITGKAPWHDVSDPVSVLYQVGFSGEVPEIPNFLSEQGKDFVTKCLKTDPNERWSVGELLQHEFVQDSSCVSKNVNDSSSNSPTSVLDRGFWDSLEVWKTTQDPNLNLNLNPTQDHRCSQDSPSARSRIRRLSSSTPNWGCDDTWITVRVNGITQPGRFFNGQEYQVGESNEETQDCGIDNANYVREEKCFLITYESRTVSIDGLSNCCDVSDVCCIRESLLGCSLCIVFISTIAIFKILFILIIRITNPYFTEKCFLFSFIQQ